MWFHVSLANADQSKFLARPPLSDNLGLFLPAGVASALLCMFGSYHEYPVSHSHGSLTPGIQYNKRWNSLPAMIF